MFAGRAWLLAVALCALATACSGGHHATVAASSTPAPSTRAIVQQRPAAATAAAPTPAPTGFTIPWKQDSTRPVPTLADLPTCSLAQLDVVDGSGQGVGGGEYHTIVVVNRSLQPCRLHGRPSVELLDAFGALVDVPTNHRAAVASGPDILLVPTKVQVVQHLGQPWGAAFQLNWSDSTDICPGRTSGLVRFYGVRVHLPDVNDPATVMFGEWYDTCVTTGVSTQPLALMQPRYPTIEFDGPVSVELTAPDAVARGSTLSYTVTLYNSSEEPIAADDYCPAFLQLFVRSESLSAIPAIVGGRADCTGLAPLEGRHEATFAIQLPVATTTPVGAYELVWVPLFASAGRGEAGAVVQVR